MSGRAVILAAHGSRSQPQVNAIVADWAAELAARGIADEVLAAFHQGTPTFAEALDALVARDVIVVPVMTSRGYYCDEVLPRELARNRSFKRRHIRRIDPFGTHPGLVAAVAERVERLMCLFDLALENTHILIVGHGTRRNVASRAATERLADRLSKRIAARSIRPAFLDDDPGIEEAAGDIPPGPLVAIPFLIGAGGHALVDLPDRLGMSIDREGALPRGEHAAGRFVVCDRPIGADPGMVELLGGAIGGAIAEAVDVERVRSVEASV